MPSLENLVLLFTALAFAPTDAFAAVPQLPGPRPPARTPPPPPPDPAKVAADAKAAADQAAQAARDAADKLPRPTVPAGGPPPARTPSGSLGKADCALIVVSAELADTGDQDIKLLYDFAEGAGAYLPRLTVGDRYKEIVVLDRGNGKLASLFTTLDRLTKAYRAVDLIVHCHGEPFQLLWDDLKFDVYDAACQADPNLRSTFRGEAQSAGVQVALNPPRRGFLSAKDGGGGDLHVGSSNAGYAERFRILDLNGGALQAGDPVQVATAAGHYWVAEHGGGTTWRADRDSAAEWETFTLQMSASALADGVAIGFKTRNGQFLGVKNGRPTAIATSQGPDEKFEVKILSRTTGSLPVVPLSADQRSRLRYCLETACYGASHAPGWRKLGFKVVAGARGVHCDSAASFPAFLLWWRNGYSFTDCIDAANRADRTRAWDTWAKKHGFRDVDSHRLVRGLGNLDYASNPVQ